MDESGNITPQPGEGELAVRSRFISDGYWNDPELTKKHFPADLITGKGSVYLTGDVVRIRADGCIIHMGRRDAQIKVRGYIVNLNEIEGALRSMEGITAAAAMGVENHEGKTQIVAYIQRKESCHLSIAEIRKALAEILPGYMIPAMFLNLDHFPVTSGGKLDRLALPLPEHFRPEEQADFQEPKTNTERALCQLLSDLLSIESVGAADHIFYLGADSMTVFQLIAKIKTTLQVDIAVQTIFDTPVVQDLAQKIDAFRQK